MSSPTKVPTLDELAARHGLDLRLAHQAAEANGIEDADLLEVMVLASTAAAQQRRVGFSANLSVLLARGSA